MYTCCIHIRTYIAMLLITNYVGNLYYYSVVFMCIHAPYVCI